MYEKMEKNRLKITPKVKKILLLIIILIGVTVIIAAGISAISDYRDVPKAPFQSVEIRTANVVTIDFVTRECSIYEYQENHDPKLTRDNTTFITAEEEAIQQYHEYFVTFAQNVYRNEHKYQGTRYKRGNDYSPERSYWTLLIVDANGETFPHSGVSAFPKDWKEFCAKTNELLGSYYLSDDTEGLPLK